MFVRLWKALSRSCFENQRGVGCDVVSGGPVDRDGPSSSEEACGS